jgi:hypothetical protein
VRMAHVLLWGSAVALAAGMAATGCEKGGSGNGAADGDSDADTDVDSDTDVDTDADSDADTDTLSPGEDSDGDGISDADEGAEDLDDDDIPNYLDDDSDGDGFTDEEESEEGSDQDSDGDGTPDYQDFDSDNDGLPDSEEHEHGTDPTDPDSDDDGYMDVVEVAYGSDPLSDGDAPPADVFFVILPFEAPEHEFRDLEFGTEITRADVLIMVDLSGSMEGEHNNLKTGINDVIIDGITAVMPDAAFGLVKFGTWEDATYEVAQAITTDAAAVETAVDTIAACGGSEEAHAETLYQAATGEGFEGTACLEWLLSWCVTSVSVDLPAASCPAGTVGGACFRPDSMPIFIMLSDEAFGSWDFDTGTPHGSPEAIAAMNAIGAKFIGLDSGESMADFEEIAVGTGSTDGVDTFNLTINADGTGVSDQVVESVVDLTANVQLDVTTAGESVANPFGVITTQFIKAIVPVSASPADQVDSMDTTTFYGVDPGTLVTFNVDFYNDFFEPETPEATLFEATIHVVSTSAILSSRQVYIIVPGAGGDVIVE